MTEWFIKRFVRDYANVNNVRVRKSYGILSGSVGILVNVLLCTMKLVVGFLSGSVAIIGDGINNLSDAGSSIVTMFGLKMSAKPADEEHPYGHGRIEYIAGMIIAGVIILVGFQLIVTSVKKLFAPEPIEVSAISIGVMVISILFKLWLGSFNKTLGKKTASPVFAAVAADSMSDCVATSVVILCLLIYAFTGYNLDAAAGIVVGCFIMYSGWTAAKETLQPILGSQADPELLQQITDIAMDDTRILGIHDVIAHSYGPGNVFASVHIEVPSDMTLIRAHHVANRLENAIAEKLDIEATVHVDPKVVGNERYDAMEKLLTKILANIDASLSMHDLHIFHGKRLIFDVEAPYSFAMNEQELEQEINQRLRTESSEYEAELKLDRV